VSRPVEFDDRVTKSLRVTPETDARLKAVAAERGVSVNTIINAAIEGYLTRLVPLSELLRVVS
jgi:predicted HicB family RNase H-like nuclease